MDVVAQGKGQGAGGVSGGRGWVNVQICSFCWFQANPNRKPHRVAHSPHERCFDCDTRTNSGIYVRRQERAVDWHDE